MLRHIAFMATDSAASVAGGRGNWALPRELADFDGDPSAGSVTGRCDGWELRVTTTARAHPLPMPMPMPMPLPMSMTMRAAQVWARRTGAQVLGQDARAGSARASR
jgi:hypothetical protein